MCVRSTIGWSSSRKCYDGMIVGFSATATDATDLAAAVGRVVHVTVLGETQMSLPCDVPSSLGA